LSKLVVYVSVGALGGGLASYLRALPRSGARARPVTFRRQFLQGASGRDGVGVVGAGDAFADGEGAFEEGSGGGLVALSLEQAGQVVEAVSCVGVIRPQRPFADSKGALKKGLAAANSPCR
jgi:hypothetical protein